MANITIYDALGNPLKTFATGIGSDADPAIPGFQLVDPITKAGLELDESYGKKVMPIHIEHPHDSFFNRHLHRETATVQALTAAASKNTYTLTVANSSGFAPPCKVIIEDDSNCEGDSIKVMSQSTGVITLARKLDFNHAIGINIRKVELNMAVNGSVTPVSFVFRPPANCITHVETVNWYIKTPGDSADTLFGGGPALARGIHMREVKGATSYRTIGVYRINQRFRVYDYTLQSGDRASPAEDYWVWASIHLRDQNDGIIRLNKDNNDYLEVIVQDDLTNATNYTEVECTVGGHFEI